MSYISNFLGNIVSFHHVWHLEFTVVSLCNHLFPVTISLRHLTPDTDIDVMVFFATVKPKLFIPFWGLQQMSHLMTKPTKWHMRPAKTEISLGIRPVWSEPLLCAQWVAKDQRFLHADNEDSDQTGRMPRLIWVFPGHTCHFVGFFMRRLICQSFQTGITNNNDHHLLVLFHFHLDIHNQYFGILRTFFLGTYWAYQRLMKW